MREGEGSVAGAVFDVRRFSLHDGPGIRTTVFLKGCPLRCLWCHNPESWRREPEILFLPEKCFGCGRCLAACPRQCHRVVDGQRIFEREKCLGCGSCAAECFFGALKLAGRMRSAADVAAEVLSDRPFYQSSGGGVTVSGGEPAMQFEFTCELLRRCRESGVHTALDTCGQAAREIYEALLPQTDLFLYDFKAADPEKHRRLTGVDNQLILENLKFLDQAGAAIILRCPLIPGLNDAAADLDALAACVGGLRNVRAVELEPYHPLGEDKYRQLGRMPRHRADFPPPELPGIWRERLARQLAIPVQVGSF